jgi:3-hydroxyisobutyrate dehydrogenase-like beta-hydroxyacid dehydrogenase
MVTVGIVSPGQMGSALGRVLRDGGARVVVTLEGRSARTAGLAEGLETLPTLADVAAAADIVLSVTPPAAARPTARSLAATGTKAIVADLNAVSPPTMRAIAGDLTGLRLVDGSISGGPPTSTKGPHVYLSGPDAGAVAGLPWGPVTAVVIGEEIGPASALKMCTGGVYKGLTALVAQALRTAGANGVLDLVVADLARNGLADTTGLARSAPKAHRFVAEMREVAATQEAAGLTPDLFTAIAAVYAGIAGTRLAEGFPETAPELDATEIVARLRVE